MTKNEKKIILRHDVDNPFVYRKSLFNKLMNRFYLSNSKIPRNENLPGYLAALREILELEDKFNARGTFFFRTVTSPSFDLIQQMRKKGHEIAYHADRIETFQEFHTDLKKLQQKTKCEMIGFTKHGFAKIRSGGIWNEKKMIEYAKLSNMKYLAQGQDHPEWEEPQLINGIYVFGHHLTIKKSNMKELTHYIESHKWPLLMLHPEDLFIGDEKEKFIELLKKYKTISIEDLINQLA